ncbi:hypothetical protein [Streptomyces rimosus]|uniref:hypothetical protein n=1 Tax=Streptomyces rimosus TaxID=1927 RepID=UPI00131BB011|nr:hypothetical protein [Streptomyces rimosus]
MPLVLQVDGKGVALRPKALPEATRKAAAESAAAGHAGRPIATGDIEDASRQLIADRITDCLDIPGYGSGTGSTQGGPSHRKDAVG